MQYIWSVWGHCYVWYHQGRLLTLNTPVIRKKHSTHDIEIISFFTTKCYTLQRNVEKGQMKLHLNRLCSFHNCVSWEPCGVCVSYTHIRSMSLPSPLWHERIGRRAEERVSCNESAEAVWKPGTSQTYRASIINRERIASRFFIADQFKSIRPETDSTQVQHKHDPFHASLHSEFNTIEFNW